MARMTRAESQAQTRSQLVATAKQMFFTDGYHPTSLEKVADAAGYSKGAVYSNFRNKDELCVAVLDEMRADRFTEVLDVVAKPDRFEALHDWAESVIGDPGWTPLEAEFAVHARRDEIDIMQLVGASDWFIRWPFILEGMLVGALGAVASLALIFAVSGPVTSVLLGFLDVLPINLGPEFAAQLIASVFGVALLVGAGGATLSVRAQLGK